MIAQRWDYLVGKTLRPSPVTSCSVPRGGREGPDSSGCVPARPPQPQSEVSLTRPPPQRHLDRAEECLLPGLVCPVPSRGGEAGTGVGERGLGGGVGHPVTAELQVGPIEQLSTGPLVLLVVDMEALSQGAPWGALCKDAIDRLIEGELPGVRACIQELAGDGIGGKEFLGGEVGAGL